MSAAAYYAKMRGYADEMSAARKPLDDEDLMSFILSGLDPDCNPMVESIVGMSPLMTSTPSSFLLSHVLSIKSRIVLLKLTQRSVAVVAAAFADAMLVLAPTVDVMVLLRRPLKIALNVRSTRSMAMKLAAAGSGSIGSMSLKIRWPMLCCLTPTTLTPLGIWILVPRITLPVTLTSLL